MLGATDAKGEFVKDRPVYQWDLLATMYVLLGIVPTTSLPHPQGKQLAVSPTAEEGYEIGGRLEGLV